MRKSLILILVLAIAPVAASRGTQPTESEQAAARADFGRLASSRAESVRLMAVGRLAGMDFPWRIELLSRLVALELRQQEPRDRDAGAIPVVAAAAIELAGSSRRADSVAALVDVIVGEKRRPLRTAMILALGAIQLGARDDDLPWDRIEPALDLALASPDARERISAIEAYAGLGRTAKLESILANRTHEDPAVRSAVVQAVADMFVKTAPRGLEELAEMLEVERGKLLLEVMLALQRMTGYADCGHDPDCWRALIAALGRGAAPPQVDDDERTEVLWGLPLLSERMLFVVDCSSSMAGWKWDRVTSALAAAIDGLEPHQSFDLLFFADDVITWNGSLLAATRANREKARKRIERQLPVDGGQTDLFGALAAAFSRAGRGVRTEQDGVGVDTIVFVTDGSPTVGEISLRTPQLDERGEPRVDERGKPIPISQKECRDRIARAIQATNRFRRVALHVIGIGRQDEGLDEGLLKRLVEICGGTYRSVER